MNSVMREENMLHSNKKRLERMPPIYSFPVCAILPNTDESNERRPIEIIGEKSMSPILNGKRLKRLRYGSQSVEKNFPTTEYSTCGNHVKIILIKQRIT